MPSRRLKAQSADECLALEHLPNVGPALAASLRRIGILSPEQLRTADAFELYEQLSMAVGKPQDPCVLDAFLSITDFMRGAHPAPWWVYTARRKAARP